MLMIPPSNAMPPWCVSNPNDPVWPAYPGPGCTRDQMISQEHVIYEIAEATGIPDHHVVNAYYLLHAPGENFQDNAPDNVHPNLKGSGKIAQDIFMKMSQSPEIQDKIKKVKEGSDHDWNNAVRMQLSS